jgi:hypothetical protein
MALRHLPCVSDNALSKFACRCVDVCGRHVRSSLTVSVVLCCPCLLGILFNFSTWIHCCTLCSKCECNRWSLLVNSHFALIYRLIKIWTQFCKSIYQTYKRSRDSSVGIATTYGLDDRGVGVRVSVGSSRILSSPNRPDRLWDTPNLLSNGFWGSFPGGKAAGAWSWPLTSN